MKLNPMEQYREIGIRSYGNGIFHKGPVPGSTLGAKRVLAIQPGDLVFNNVFAWEGAVAVASESEVGMIGSHRFVTYTVNPAIASAAYLKLYFATEIGREILLKASPGSAGRNKTLGLERFISAGIPLPPVAEQRRIVSRVDAVAARIADARRLQNEVVADLDRLLMATYRRLVDSAPYRPMGEVAPLVRRKVDVVLTESYPELGIRSFGKGTFHKPPLAGSEVGTKKLFEIHPGDLVFSNVFAWEGAIAVVQPEDAGRFGSHRFITCVPHPSIATSPYLRFYFRTAEGSAKIQDASPGGAGRNRTLGIEALAKITVPVPPVEKQHEFDALQAKADALRGLQAEASAELDALLPAVLAKAFAGDL